MATDSMKKIVFLFCFLFSLNSQADLAGCLNALRSESLNQENAYLLSKAIINGDLEKINKLAKPWLNKKDHGYVFNNNYGLESETDLLLFAARASTSNLDYSKDAIKSLETLVKMGFTISTEDRTNRERWADFYWFNFGRFAFMHKVQKQIFDALMDAELTAEKLYWAEGESPVHQSLLIWDHYDKFTSYRDKFEIIINSGLITKNNIDLKFYPRDYYYERKNENYPHNVKTTLLHWNSAWSVEKVKLLIKKGADPNVTVDITDKENVYAPMERTPLKTAQVAKNYPVVIELIQAGANTNVFNINYQIGEYYGRPLLHWALDSEVIFEANKINTEPIEKLIELGASPFITDGFGENAFELIKKHIDILNDEIIKLEKKLEQERILLEQYEERITKEINNKVNSGDLMTNSNQPLNAIETKNFVETEIRNRKADYIAQHEQRISEIKINISVQKYTLEEYQKSLEIITPQ